MPYLSTHFWDKIKKFFYYLLLFWDAHAIVQVVMIMGKSTDMAIKILQAMSKNNISYGELSVRTGIPKSALQRYATGATEKIPLPRVEQIAKALNLSAAYLMGWETSAQPDLPVKVERDIDNIYDALNRDGQKELCRYGRYLTTQEEFKAEDAQSQIEYIRHYLTAAAAGYAAPIEGEDYEEIPRDASVPIGADFCIDIDGDSMEPYIKNGQRVYVQQNTTLNDFDVGIFFVDGDVYCKQWCVDYAGTLHLLSANPKREDANISIPKDSDRNVVCFGKVIMKKKLPPPSL